MVWHAARALLEGGVSRLRVVVGHEEERVRAALPLDRRLEVVHSPDYRRGMGASLAAGARGLEADGVLVALADMPHLRPSTVRAVLDAFASAPEDIVAPIHQGRRGHPVAFDRRFIAALAALDGDVGAAPLLRRHAADLLALGVDDPGILLDVDTPATGS
jgi:molybdenum cofactor cytidylyltransferase